MSQLNTAVNVIRSCQCHNCEGTLLIVKKRAIVTMQIYISKVMLFLQANYVFYFLSLERIKVKEFFMPVKKQKCISSYSESQPVAIKCFTTNSYCPCSSLSPSLEPLSPILKHRECGSATYRYDK